MAVSADIQAVIDNTTQTAIANAPYDKTEEGVVRRINTNGTASVETDRGTSLNVKIYGLVSNVKVKDTVTVVIPQNNPQDMFIISPSVEQDDIIITDATVNEYKTIGYIDV